MGCTATDTLSACGKAPCMPPPWPHPFQRPAPSRHPTPAAGPPPSARQSHPAKPKQDFINFDAVEAQGAWVWGGKECTTHTCLSLRIGGEQGDAWHWCTLESQRSCPGTVHPHRHNIHVTRPSYSPQLFTKVSTVIFSSCLGVTHVLQYMGEWQRRLVGRQEGVVVGGWGRRGGHVETRQQLEGCGHPFL